MSDPTGLVNKFASTSENIFLKYLNCLICSCFFYLSFINLQLISVAYLKMMTMSFFITELKKNYLIAVSHLLTFLPRQVLVSELPPVSINLIDYFCFSR